MSLPSIVPAAKALYLCDGAIGFPDQKSDIMGLFNSIRPEQYPYVHEKLVVFAQLSSGLGQVPFSVDVRYARTGELMHKAKTRMLKFERRSQVIQVSRTINDCPFPQPGVYLIELLCNGVWVADTNLELLELE
jgi:hypothetical protein